MRLFSYAAMCLIFWGLTIAPAFSEDYVAKVNETVIKDSDLIKRMQLLPPAKRSGDAKKRVLNNMIEEELVLQQAGKLNLMDTDAYKSRLESAKLQILVDLYMKKFLDENNTPENQEKYYEQNKEKYKSRDSVRVSAILVKTEEDAKNIFEKLGKGEDFSELAKKHSIDPSAQMGGDLGFMSVKSIGKFSRLADSMKVGEIKGPIKSEQGYHIIKVTERKEGSTEEFVRVKMKVATDYQYKLVKDKIEELRKAAKIDINTELLDKVKVN